MTTKHEPKITKEAGANWAVATFTGTLYETQTSVLNFLNSNQVKNSASAKIATDTFQNVAYTFVVFES
jgi:hypothetical protein